MQVKCPFQITAYGRYLPGKPISADSLQERMEVDAAWINKKTGAVNRYYASSETIAEMGSLALKEALKNSALELGDIDLLIAAGGTPDQPIPHNSALMHKELGAPKTMTPMDVNATCLSFIQGMMVAASFLTNGLYKNIAIVSSEISSKGLNYEEPESSSLLGDGAVAFILSKTTEDKGLIFADFETYNEGVHFAEIPGGGTRIHPKEVQDTQSDIFKFKMDGERIFKLASKHFSKFYHGSLNKNEMSLADFKMVIPHQASLLAMTLMQKKLKIPNEKIYYNVHKYGNLVAASIPMGLLDLLEDETLESGDNILMIATAAGLTIGNIGIRI